LDERVTISKHTLPDSSSHLDVFFENSSELLTTYEVFSPESILLVNEILECVKKQDHRKIYLDYEGEISNNRGSIKIVWKGIYRNKKSIGKNKISIFILDETLFIVE
jgi:hypothetical protein